MNNKKTGIGISQMNENDRYGYLWCLLNSTPELNNNDAVIELMHEIEQKLSDKEIDRYWQEFISN